MSKIFKNRLIERYSPFATSYMLQNAQNIGKIQVSNLRLTNALEVFVKQRK